MKQIYFLALACLLCTGWALTSENRKAPFAPSEAEASPAELPSERFLPAPLSKSLVLKVEAAGPTPLLHAIEAGDLCLTKKLLSQTKVLSAEEAPALLAHFGASSALQELLGKEGPIFGGNSNSRLSSPLAKLYLALKLSGQISWADSPRDLKAAREIFLELEAKDPANGAFPFLRLTVEKQLGLPGEALALTAQQATRASYFDLYMGKELRDLQASRFENAAAYLALESLMMSLRQLNYFESGPILVAMDEEHHSHLAEEMGRLLREEGERANRGTALYGFLADPYDQGGSLLGPGQKWSYDRNVELEGDAAFPDSYNAERALEKTTCDPSEYEVFFQAMKSHL